MRTHTKTTKLTLATLATAVCLVPASSAQAKQATHVATTVKIAYQAPGGEYTPDTGFTGKVKAKKGCKAKRTVKLTKYGKTKTSKRGTYAFGVSGSGADPGKYKVKVLEKTIKGGKVVCDPISATITIN